MIKHVFNEAFFKGFPLLTYLAIDLEYFGVVNNSWIPKSIGIWNITNNSFVKRIHLLSDNFDALNENAISITEARRICKILLKDKVVVMWNADEDLKSFPYIAQYSIGVHCAMVRMSRIFGMRNEFYGDRKFMTLSNAASEIGFNYLPSEKAHDEMTDARMTSEVWKYLDEYNLPQDPIINMDISKKATNINNRQLCLEFDIYDSELNDFKLKEKYKRQQYKKCQITTIEDGSFILDYGNIYDESSDKIRNINPFKLVSE